MQIFSMIQEEFRQEMIRVQQLPLHMELECIRVYIDHNNGVLQI